MNPAERRMLDREAAAERGVRERQQREVINQDKGRLGAAQDEFGQADFAHRNEEVRKKLEVLGDAAQLGGIAIDEMSKAAKKFITVINKSDRKDWKAGAAVGAAGLQQAGWIGGQLFLGAMGF